MTAMSGEVYIARPPAEVCDLFTDAQLTAEHSSEHTDVYFTTVV